MGSGDLGEGLPGQQDGAECCEDLNQSQNSLLNVEPDFEGGRHSGCVAETASVKICIYLFHRYFLSIYYMPDTILGTRYRRIEQICTQMPHRLSCLACEWTNFDPSKCNVKFSSFTSFQKNPFLPNIRWGLGGGGH